MVILLLSLLLKPQKYFIRSFRVRGINAWKSIYSARNASNIDWRLFEQKQHFPLTIKLHAIQLKKEKKKIKKKDLWNGSSKKAIKQLFNPIAWHKSYLGYFGTLNMEIS